MNDTYIPPPPPYERSPKNDHKISEALQEAELAKKTPSQNDDTVLAEWQSSKEYLALQNKAMMDAPVRPLRIHSRRSEAPRDAGLRGPRPLPPCPRDAKARSANTADTAPLKVIREGKAREETSEEHLPPAPPPFTVTGPSLDGPPYEEVVGTADAYNTRPSPLTHILSSVDSSRHGNENWRPPSTFNLGPHNEPPLGRNSHNVSQGFTATPSRTRGTRLTFDPSVAYGHDNQWNGPTGLQPVNPASLYSSAVSSHVQKTPLNPGSRYPCMSPNRVYAHSRPFSANTDSLHSTTTPLSPHSTSSLPCSSASTHSLCRSPPLGAGSRRSRVRWAASESDIDIDIYRS